MSLRPGYPRRRTEDNRVVIDNQALVDSMAGYIDQAMEDTYRAMRNQALPDAGQEDRRILFVAIARGVLAYLETHQHEFVKTIRYSGYPTNYSVDTLNLDIQIENANV